MPSFQHIRTLIALDAKLVVRSRMLHVVAIVALVFGGILGWLVPDQLGPAADLSTVAAGPHSVTVLQPGLEPVPLGHRLIPLMFGLDLAILGFMFAAVMLLQDKTSGVTAFFRVGPGTTIEYITAKLAVNLGLSQISVMVLVGLAAPGLLLVWQIYPLVWINVAGMTLLGMAIAARCRDFSAFFWPMALVGLTCAAPTFAFFKPGSEFDWSWWLPTYHMIFGSEAAFFSAYRAGLFESLMFSALFTIIAAGLCVHAVHTKVMKEQG